MKKILVRAHTSPFEAPTAADMLLVDDRFGMNMGNMLFANSVIRVLMTDDVQVDILHTGRDLTPENLEKINAQYDCVVMPFANAFRVSFRRQLRMLTNFIRRLKIPCVVVGIGISATFGNPLKEKNPFDRDVKDFVKAVLEKSAVLGTRGEETAAYLTKLGFREETHHRVIGCPSMFWYGEELPPIQKRELHRDSAVSVNWKIDLPPALHAFILKNIGLFDNFQYIPQVLDEMRLMYYGIPFAQGRYRSIPEGFPCRADHPWYRQDRARAFINVPSWLDYLSSRELSFGSRIHGNIAALLAGTPAFVIVSDYRIRELVRYHQIPHADYRELRETDTIVSLYEQADYSRLYDGHRQRLRVYTDFLEENGLDHIFRHSYETVPYDRRMEAVQTQPPLQPFFSVSAAQQAQRLAEARAGYLRLQQCYAQVRHLDALIRLLHLDRKIDAFQKPNRK